MATAKVRIVGQDSVLKMVNGLSQAPLKFDNDFRKVARGHQRALKQTINKDSGKTARKWKVRRLGFAHYLIRNDHTSHDRKHSIANIIDQGRKEVVPKKAKALYIPLTRRAKNKRPGAKIPKRFTVGEDYVMAKSAKAFKGTGYIKRTTTDAEKGLLKLMLRTVGKIIQAA